MRRTAHRLSTLAVLAVVATLSLSGCAGDGGAGQDGAQDTPTPAPTADATTRSPSAPAGTPSQTGGGDSDAAETDGGAVEVEVEIENGQVTPSGRRVDVEVGQPIRFVVDSDAADEIHVHSSPEHSFSFPAGADDKTFEFTLQRPGVVEAELHELGTVVVTLAARP